MSTRESLITYARAQERQHALLKLVNNYCVCQRPPSTVPTVRIITDRFYRAMLCIRSTSHGPVSVCARLCLCLSQVGVLLKRLNVGSRKQHHTIAQGL